MNQRDRDRLVVLKKAQKKLITQRQAAEELGLTERQIRRLLGKLKESGDKAVIHGLRGRAIEPPCRRTNARRSHTDPFPKRCTKASVRRWRASTWPRNTACRSDGKASNSDYIVNCPLDVTGRSRYYIVT